MPGTNSGGLPIPLDSDPFGDAALAMRNLADGIVAVQNTRCKAYSTVNPSIPNNTATKVPFDAEEVDPTGMHSTAVNTSRITIARPGRYRATAQVGWASAAAGYRQAGLALNGGASFAIARVPPVAGVVNYMHVTGTVLCVANDFLELDVFQNSGAALAVQGGQPNTWLDVEYLGPL